MINKIREFIHDDWLNILKKAWSIRMIILAGFFSGLEIALPYLEGVLPVRNGTFAGLAFLATNAAFVMRLVAQKNLSEKDKQ